MCDVAIFAGGLLQLQQFLLLRQVTAAAVDIYLTPFLLHRCSFTDVDIALFSAGGSISKKFGPTAQKAGCIVSAARHISHHLVCRLAAELAASECSAPDYPPHM